MLKVASLAVAGAEKIVGRSIDEAANNDIIDKLVAELYRGSVMSELTTDSSPLCKAAFDFAIEQSAVENGLKC